ncbi:hypothetical protein SDC9_146557 [bioreactor metagenome]|uniref:Uncharacterized protein n=1 Tax=bioreactor metagenome TaxID=1076179 RepID=A0A645ECE5_9ZZZZ
MDDDRWYGNPENEGEKAQHHSHDCRTEEVFRRLLHPASSDHQDHTVGPEEEVEDGKIAGEVEHPLTTEEPIGQGDTKKAAV